MTFVKLVLLVGAVFVVAQARKLSDEEKEMFMMFTEECRKTHKATDEDMNTIMEGNIPSTPAAKCTMTCTMKQFKMVEEKDGKLELAVENMMKMAEANGADKEKLAIAKEVAEKCKSPAVTEECEFSAAVATCGQKEAEARGIKIDDI